MSSIADDFANLDLFSDTTLLDPFPTYAALRDAAPAVWLDRHQVWAVARYADVRRALARHAIFISGEGIGLTPESNETTRGSILSSDPPVHGVLRGVLNERLSPSGLLGMREPIQLAADRLVDELAERQSFDAVDDLAKAFPVSIVLDLIGVPHEVRPKLLGWADAMFNTFGPPNERTMRSLPVLGQMAEFLHRVNIDMLTPGSLGAAVFEAGERGVLTPHQCAVLLGAYLGAGLDTTINSISALILQFSRNPDQWELVRQDPSLVPQALDEVLRIDSPVLGFTRLASENTEIDGVPIPSGDRVLLLYASANRDPRKWTDPERFDVMRAPADHLAFGLGRHLCAGQLLARIEVESLMRALARRARGFETDDPVYHLNNVIRGLGSLPTRIAT
jgi:cytochrome P450